MLSKILLSYLIFRCKLRLLSPMMGIDFQLKSLLVNPPIKIKKYRYGLDFQILKITKTIKRRTKLTDFFI
jgi:hypothetical protein